MATAAEKSIAPPGYIEFKISQACSELRDNHSLSSSYGGTRGFCSSPERAPSHFPAFMALTGATSTPPPIEGQYFDDAGTKITPPTDPADFTTISNPSPMGLNGGRRVSLPPHDVSSPPARRNAELEASLSSPPPGTYTPLLPEPDWIILCFGWYNDLAGQPNGGSTGVPQPQGLESEVFAPDQPQHQHPQQPFLEPQQLLYNDRVLTNFEELSELSLIVEDMVSKGQGNVEEVRGILDACGFFPERAFGVLIDNAMVIISKSKLYMHGLLQQLGCEIVCEEAEENWKHSRLWKPDDVHNVLAKGTDTKRFEGLFLDMAKSREMCWSPKAFEKMFKLRLLKLHSLKSSQGRFKVQLLDECIQSLSDELRYFQWDGCASKSLPSHFCPENLADLNLPFNNIEQLWAGKQQLGYLKLINLSHSNLTRIPALSTAQQLEILNLQDCAGLVDVSSIQCLTKLKSLNLKGCKSLGTVPKVVGLKSLETLDISVCSQLDTLPKLPRNMKYLYVGGTAIEELPSSLGDLAFLVILDVKNCTRLPQIPISTSKLKSLESLNISGCPHLLKRLSGNGNVNYPNQLDVAQDARASWTLALRTPHVSKVLVVKGTVLHCQLVLILPIRQKKQNKWHHRESFSNRLRKLYTFYL